MPDSGVAMTRVGLMAPLVLLHGVAGTRKAGALVGSDWNAERRLRIGRLRAEDATVTGFGREHSDAAGVVPWRGAPDDDHAHQAILGWLEAAVTADEFLPLGASLSNRMKGNLGEFVAYRIGTEYVFTNVALVDTANAWTPLSDISRPDIDIVWLYFGQTDVDDWAALQEVKTTGVPSLSLADDLIEDYEKLFGENLRFTLQTRLTAMKNKLEQMGNGHLAARVTRLGGPSPDLARGLKLVPTLLHDGANDSSRKMVAVRQALIGKGWSSDVVECWSVALGQIDARLARIAKGQR